MRRVLVSVLALAALLSLLAASADAKVLRVGTYHGVRGQYATIQAAVRAAKPGDWILIGPGDYKTAPSAIRAPKGHPGFPADVLITQRNLHLRGMNRNTVIVDGTRPGSSVCSAKAAAQNFGPRGHGSESGYAVDAAADRGAGLNGLMVYRAANVSIQNLTACNFLGGTDGDGSTGNEIWWNGGDGSGKIGGHGFTGSYLTATSTYLKGKSKADEVSAAEYGIFSSNWTGGTWNEIYASNFNDSGFYIGACKQVCDQTIDHAWGQYNALGYSGSNSGGRMLIENSQFDDNEDGFDTNSQNGDNPPPQNGACPGNGVSSITHTHSCWVFIHNYVHNNNNPNVPSEGSAAAGPVGTGMTVSGGRNDTVMDNRFVDNNAWGVLFVPWPNTGKPCTGGTPNYPLLGAGSCLFDEWNDALIDNKFSRDGSYGHPTDGDFEQINFEGGHPTDCFRGNTDAGGLTPEDVTLEQQHPSCDGSPAASDIGSQFTFLTQVLCDDQVVLIPGEASCPAGTSYPRVTRIVMHPLPTRQLKTMPSPCAGVPSNPWCGKGKKA